MFAFAWARASAAVSALAIALSKTGVRVVSPVLVTEARIYSRILGRNLEFGSLLKSHFWAGYVCFVLLRECISISVTCGDSCDR